MPSPSAWPERRVRIPTRARLPRCSHANARHSSVKRTRLNAARRRTRCSPATGSTPKLRAKRRLRSRSSEMRTDQFSRLLLGAYLVALAVLVFLPSGRAMELGDRLNLEPLATIDRALDLGPRSLAFRLMIANIAAFIPLGTLLP